MLRSLHTAALAGITLTSVALGSMLPGAVHASSPPDTAQVIAAQHNGYVVVGKELGVRVVRAAVALEQCQATTGVQTAQTCVSSRDALAKAENTLLLRGKDAINASEPASTDPIYASFPVIVAPQGDINAVIIELPAALAVGAVRVTTAVSGLTRHLPMAILADQSRNHPAKQVHDGGQLPTVWKACDGTWCLGRVDIHYSPAGQGWSLIFTYDVKFSQNCTNWPGQTIWGSNWVVSDSGIVGQSWSNLRYTNIANTSHNEEWPNANGNVTTTVNGQVTSTAYAHIAADMDCAGTHWNWTGNWTL